MDINFKSLINHLINQIYNLRSLRIVENNQVYDSFSISCKRLIIPKLFTTSMSLIIGLTTIQAQITQVGSATSVYGAGVQTVTVAQPSGLAIGDLVIVTVVQSNTLTNSIPVINNITASWTCISSTLNAAGTVQTAVLYKFADYNTVNNPIQVCTNSVWWPQADYMEASMVAYRGVDPTTPFDVTPGSITASGNGVTSISPTSITTVSPNALVISLGMSYRSGSNTNPRSFSSWSLTSPSITEIYDAQGTNYVSLGAATGTKVTAGATGAGTITVSGSAYLGGINLALRPVIQTPCTYNSNSSSGITVLPIANMASNPQTVSASFASGNYFVMNVIKGLTYQVYTTNSPSQALKMVVYEEGNSSGSVLASSFSNTGNPENANVNNVCLLFTSPLSGQVRVLINTKADCASTAITGLTVKSNISGGTNMQDDSNAAGTDTWTGHLYDSQSTTYRFDNYLGYYNVGAETFQEAFGTGGTWPNNTNDDVTSFNVYSNGSVRAKILDLTYAVHYRMNSTKRGFYKVDITSDDGVNLYVDGTSVYNRWNDHSPTTDANLLISLSGSSSLVLDYYEQGGQNIIGFYNLASVFSNTLSIGTTQVLCKSTAGTTISGDVLVTLATGYTSQGYQWTYSTTPTGTRTVIAGATGATYAPNSSSAPFNNVAGIYYLYRNASIKTINNVSPNPTTLTNESNPAVIRIKGCPDYWTGNSDTNWQNTSNWSDGVPLAGDNVEFAATSNMGNGGLDAARNLILDQDYVVGAFTNKSGKQLIIPTSTSLTVNDTILSTDVVGDKIYIKSSSSAPNGSLIFHNKTTKVYGTVEMYSKAFCTDTINNKNYKWQFFGIPIAATAASPTFNGSYVRRWDETGTTNVNHWIQLNNAGVLNPFYGYEITQRKPTTIVFRGQLINTDFNSSQLPVTSGALFPGQHIFANPYTAAIDISKLSFGSSDVGVIENTVYLYSTGSFAEWTSVAGSNTPLGGTPAPGQYTSVPINLAGGGLGLPSQVPSMQALLVRAHTSVPTTTFKISYNAVAIKNTTQQRISANKSSTPISDKVGTMIEVIGAHYSDKMWLFSEPTCSHSFDNGWDGTKMLGSALSPQIYAVESDGIYQVNTVDDINNTLIGFQPGEDLNYTLSFTHMNLDGKYAKVYLIDSVENKTIDITESGSTYSFVAETTQVPLINRFKITTLNIEKKISEPDAEPKNLKVFSNNNAVYVDNSSSESGEFYVYNAIGQFIRKDPFGPNTIATFDVGSAAGVYIIRAATTKERISKRIIVKQHR